MMSLSFLQLQKALMNAQDEINKKLIEADEYKEEIKSQRFQISELRHVTTDFQLLPMKGYLQFIVMT